MENLQYPIGRFDKTKVHTIEEAKNAAIYLIDFSEQLIQKVKDLNNEQLAKYYRPGGWNIRQIVHHLADSHANLYIRLKCTITEDNPTIKGYNEADWAELIDSTMPLDSSLKIIEGLHLRIGFLVEKLEAHDFEKTYYHPGYKSTYVLKNVLPLYEWHSKHHLEHINIALKS
jgi:hypothetical protein